MASEPNFGGGEHAVSPQLLQLCQDPIEAMCQGWNFLEASNVAYRTHVDLDYPSVTSAIEQGLGFGVGLGLAVVRAECHVDEIKPHLTFPRYFEEAIPMSEMLAMRVRTEAITGNETFWHLFEPGLRGAIIQEAFPRMHFNLAQEVNICMATLAIGYTMVEWAYKNWNIHNQVVAPGLDHPVHSTRPEAKPLSNIDPHKFADAVIQDMWAEIDKNSHD